MSWIGMWWCQTPAQVNCEHDGDWNILDTGACECVLCGAVKDPLPDDDYDREDFED